jgi:hypothetical protein
MHLPALSYVVLHCTPQSRTVLHCPALYYIVRNCLALFWTVLHSPELSYGVLRCHASSCTVLRCPALYSTVRNCCHCPALSCTVLHSPELSCGVLHCPTMSCIVLHCPALSCKTLEYRYLVRPFMISAAFSKENLSVDNIFTVDPSRCKLPLNSPFCSVVINSLLCLFPALRGFFYKCCSMENGKNWFYFPISKFIPIWRLCPQGAVGEYWLKSCKECLWSRKKVKQVLYRIVLYKGSKVNIFVDRMFPLFASSLKGGYLHCPALYSTVQNCPALSCIILHCTQQSCIVRHCPALSCTVLHSPELSCGVLHCPALSCRTLDTDILRALIKENVSVDNIFTVDPSREKLPLISPIVINSLLCLFPALRGFFY